MLLLQCRYWAQSRCVTSTAQVRAYCRRLVINLKSKTAKTGRAPRHARYVRVSKKPPTVKTRDNIVVSNKAFSLGRRWQKSLIFDGCGVKACYARRFDLLRNSHSSVPPVRRRVGVACLAGSFDLCQSVKNLFDRLTSRAFPTASPGCI